MNKSEYRNVQIVLNAFDTLFNRSRLCRLRSASGPRAFVILHGRFSGLGQRAAWVVGDIVRMEDGMLAEHWDVIQDQATREQSRSGLPLFGEKFPD